jgi:pilin/secretion family protein with methylation motif
VAAVHNNKGVTLIEILLSIVLTAIVFGGLLKSSLLVVNNNIENLLRDEAVNIAGEKMNEARDLPFASLLSDPADVPVVRNFRSITGFQFATRRTIVAIDSNTKQVTISVSWIRKGVPHNHNITTLIRKAL